MPKVIGLIFPKLCHACNDLESVAPLVNHHDYGGGENEEVQNARREAEPRFSAQFPALRLFISQLYVNAIISNACQ